MGLDSVEIVLGVEETFQIQIPDAAAAEMITPRDVINYVAQQVSTCPAGRCIAQETFFRLRRGFRNQIPALVPQFRLATSLKDVLHKDQWPQVWSAIRAQIGQPNWPETVPWPHFWNRGPRTIRQLVYYIATRLPTSRPAVGEPWTREQIALRVRQVIDDVIGKMDFDEDAHFIRDLRVG